MTNHAAATREFNGVGTVQTIAGQHHVEMVVGAASALAAKRKLQCRFDSRDGSLAVIYRDWEYTHGGALRGDIAWRQTQGGA
jgi:hypothetical protein